MSLDDMPADQWRLLRAEVTERNVFALAPGDLACLPTTGWAHVRWAAFAPDGGLDLSLDGGGVEGSWRCPRDRIGDVVAAVPANPPIDLEALVVA